MIEIEYETAKLKVESKVNKVAQIVLKGIPASSGIIMGKARILEPETLISPDIAIPPEQIEEEVERFFVAKKTLEGQFAESIQKVQYENANILAILETNILILNDEFISDAIVEGIRSGLSVESSVVKEFEKQRNFFLSSKDGILRERAMELDHIKQSLTGVLRNQTIYYETAKNAIVVAQTLTPTDIVNYKDAGMLGFITEVGGIASHVSILARSFDIPAVIGVKESVTIIKDNDNLIIDGFTGVIVVNPSEEVINLYRKKIQEIAERQKRLGALVKLPAETTDGKKIHILTNVNVLEDVRTGTINGADGVGLVRSEFLIMELQKIPDEEIQYKWYKEIADRVYPNPVTIRVFDVGSDKYYEGLPFNESNPALGFRGIRFLLSRRNIFETQIRAILRASSNKNVRVMLPMISSLHEVEKSIEIIEHCKSMLESEGVSFDNKIPVGIMIETPAAAIISDGLAEAVDFFSIGTNDLTQYTLAADRTNELVSDIFDSFHPAMLRLIKLIVTSAKAKGIPVGVCGELASHSGSTELLLGLGIDELSVAPSLVLELKDRIRHINLSKTQKLVDDILSETTYDQVRKRLFKALHDEKSIINEASVSDGK